MRWRAVSVRPDVSASKKAHDEAALEAYKSKVGPGR
jgi:hypothetical protein